MNFQVINNPNYDVFVKTDTSVVMPGLPELSFVQLTNTNGQRGLDAKTLLEGTATKLSVQQIEDYDNFLRNIALSASNGVLAASLTAMGNHLTIDLKVFSEEVEVSLTKDKLLLEIIVTLVLKNSDSGTSPSPSPEPILNSLLSRSKEVITDPDVITTTAAIGITVLAVIILAPTMAAAGTAISAFAAMYFLLHGEFPEDSDAGS